VAGLDPPPGEAATIQVATALTASMPFATAQRLTLQRYFRIVLANPLGDCLTCVRPVVHCR